MAYTKDELEKMSTSELEKKMSLAFANSKESKEIEMQVAKECIEELINGLNKKNELK